ncbi:hypothetical protein ACF1FY_34865, partial [Streptomyces althioticus]
ILYPTSYDPGTGHGPDPLCDDSGCICVRHSCDCDVCRDDLNIPGLKSLLDSQETEREGTMASHLIPVEMPAQLRKFAVYKLVPDTDGQHELSTLCKAANEGRSNSASVIGLTNVALGAALEIAREWRHSKNGNEIQAGRTLLKHYEMTYVPEDPRERRHEFKMPASLSDGIPGQTWALKARPGIAADLKGCSWTKTGGSGRVTYETMGWLLEWAERHVRADHPAGQRAGKRFIETYRLAWEETGRLIKDYLNEGTDRPEELDGDQEPEELVVEGEASQPKTVGREWKKSKLSRYVRWDDRPSYFWFGGVAKQGDPDSVGTLVSLTWHESKRGQNLLRDVDSGDVVATVHSSSQVWATPVDRPESAEVEVTEGQEPTEVEHQDQESAAELADDDGQAPEEEAAFTSAGESEVGPVPENWLYMAEYADTETARAWWARKVASWGR